MDKKLSKYEIIKQEIKQQIERLELKPNQVIPSESVLCDQYQVSRITVRRAIDELAHEGLLYRIKGKGCFVRERDAQKLSPIYSFTEAIINEGKKPSKKQLSFMKQKAGKALGEKMGINEEDTVYIIKCLYFADEEPYSLNTSILPEKLFPKLECFNFNNNSLYDVLKTFYNLSFTKERQTIVATMGTEEINKYLNLKEKKPLLKIDASSYCLCEDHETIFEVYESYILTDILSYFVEKYNM